MKRQVIRFIAVVVSLVFLVGSIAACGESAKNTANEETAGKGQTTQSASTVSEGVKAMEADLKFAFPGDPPKGQDGVNKVLGEQLAKAGLNFKLDFTFIPWDQYWNKLALIAAGGEEYDITWTHVSYLSGLVAKKALAPIDEALKEYGQAIISSTPEYSFNEATIDGKIYAIPRIMPSAENRNFVQIRKDLREKYGIAEIKTVDDFEKYLEAIKTNEADMVPFCGDAGYFLLREYGNVILPLGDQMNHPIYIDPEDANLTVKSFFESDIFKNLLTKMREWDAKGYFINPTEQPNKMPDLEGALNSGKLAATWSVMMKTTERIDSFKGSMPEGELENVYLHPEKPKYIFSSVDNMLSVFSTSKQVNQSIAFINWFRTNQENYDLWSFGVKDVNYKLDGESISYEGIDENNSYVPINWSWNDIRFARFSKHLTPEYVQNLKSWDKDAKISPLNGFTVNTDNIKTEIAQLNAVMGEHVNILYNSKVDWDSTMEKFIKKLKDAGLEKVIAEVQKQVDTFKGK